MSDSAFTSLSSPCNEVITALGKAQAVMPAVVFDAVNPHFRSRYATLANILATVRPVLAAHELTLTQVCSPNGTLITFVAHKSGQWVASEVPIVADKPGPQPFFASVSLARRHCVCAILAVAPEEDDDGEGATQRAASYTPKPPAPEKPLPRQKKDLPQVQDPNAFEPPEWFDQKLGFGKYGEHTWRVLSEGGLGGQRHQYVEWLISQTADTPQQKEIKNRAGVVNKRYLSREADAF